MVLTENEYKELIQSIDIEPNSRNLKNSPVILDLPQNTPQLIINNNIVIFNFISFFLFFSLILLLYYSYSKPVNEETSQVDLERINWTSSAAIKRQREKVI